MGPGTQEALIDGPAIFPELQFMGVSSEALQESIGGLIEALLEVRDHLKDGSDMSAENRKELEFTARKLIKDIDLREKELSIRGVK